MRLTTVLLACAVCVMGVMAQGFFGGGDTENIYVPVRVQVPGILGETGGYLLAALILGAALLFSNTSSGQSITINGTTMTTSSGNGGGLPPIGGR